MPMINAPLGLPAGSVRAILALMVVGGWIGAAIWNHPMPGVDALAGAVVAYYFKSREGHDAKNMS